MIYQKITWPDVASKCYILGFPKSGLHLAELLVAKINNPCMSPHLPNPPWVGTATRRGFSVDEVEMLEDKYYKFSLCQPGEYIKGHTVYNPDVSKFLYNMGMGLIFIYRDLRDVVVSMTAHSRSTKPDRFPFLGKEMFQSMTFSDTLKAFLTGVGPYRNLVERWEAYAPWLDEDWVLPIKYEDMMNDRKETCKKIFFYLLKRGHQLHHVDIYLDEDELEGLLDEMVEFGNNQTSTYRRAQVGKWTESFNEEHLKIFDEIGGNKWLEKLGYDTAPS